jgi:hypothetical protein
MENQLAEILVEREEDSLLVRTEPGDILTWYAGALLRDREDIPASLSTAPIAGRGKFSSARNFIRS